MAAAAVPLVTAGLGYLTNRGGGGSRPPKQTQMDRKTDDKRNMYVFNRASEDLDSARGEDQAIMDRVMGSYGRAEDQLNQGSPSAAGYNEFARSGGWDPDRVTNIDKDIHGLRDYSDYGRVMAKDGGMNAKEQADFRARGISGVGSMYDSLKQNLQRGNRITGGIGPGFNSQTAALAREKSRGIHDAVLNTEVGLADRLREGRLAGADIWRTGLNDASGLEMGLADRINEGRRFGLEGLDRDYQFGVGADMDMGRALTALYGAAPGRESMLYDVINQSNQQAHNNNEDYENRSDSRNASWWERFGGLLNAGGTFASGMMGSGRPGSPRPTVARPVGAQANPPAVL